MVKKWKRKWLWGLLVAAIAIIGIGIAVPIFDRQSAGIEWAGGWDQPPLFWAAWQQSGTEAIKPLPEEYLPLLLPKKTGEYVYVGGSQSWRGLRVDVQTPNTQQADLISEYWDGQKWVVTSADGTRRNYATLNQNGNIGAGGKDWASLALSVEGTGSVPAYWARFKVTVDLDAAASGTTRIRHDAPVLTASGWEMKYHRRTACENKPGLDMLRVTVLDAGGLPQSGIRVDFAPEPSTGVAYDHPSIWGLTNANGYIEWDTFGIPTVYIISVEGVPVVGNIRYDLGNEYCRPGGQILGGWIAINRPGIYSYDLEARAIPGE